MSHATTAASLRKERDEHPERFCPHCLWRIVNGRTGESTPCRKHPVQEIDLMKALTTHLATRTLASPSTFPGIQTSEQDGAA